MNRLPDFYRRHPTYPRGTFKKVTDYFNPSAGGTIASIVLEQSQTTSGTASSLSVPTRAGKTGRVLIVLPSKYGGTMSALTWNGAAITNQQDDVFWVPIGDGSVSGTVAATFSLAAASLTVVEFSGVAAINVAATLAYGTRTVHTIAGINAAAGEAVVCTAITRTSNGQRTGSASGTVGVPTLIIEASSTSTSLASAWWSGVLGSAASNGSLTITYPAPRYAACAALRLS